MQRPGFTSHRFPASRQKQVVQKQKTVLFQYPLTCYLFLNPYLLPFNSLRFPYTVKKSCDYKSESTLQTHTYTHIKFTTCVSSHLLLCFSFLFKTLVNFPFNKTSVVWKSLLPRGFLHCFPLCYFESCQWIQRQEPWRIFQPCTGENITI